MAQSQTLDCPEDAAAALEESNKWNQDLSKWLVYACGAGFPAAREVCHEAMKAYNETNLHEPESEWDELGFARPANSSAENVHVALHLHIEHVQRALKSEQSDPWNSHCLYPSGFVAVDSRDWREKGVIVVHCDKDEQNGEWKVSQSRFKVKDLGVVLTTVLDGDDSFERVAEEYSVDKC